MNTSDGTTRQPLIVLVSLLAAGACAVQTEGFVESYVTVPTGGAGGDMSGTAAAGGATAAGGTDAMTGVGGGTGTGGTANATGGTSTGGAANATGGTSTGGAANATGGTASATGGTVGMGAGSGSGGASTGMAGRVGRGTGGTGGTDTGGTDGTGCAMLSVPMNGASDKAHFVVSLRSATDLSAPGTTINLRVYVEAGVGGVIFPYAQDSSFNFLGAATRPLLASQDGWVTLTWDIGAEPTVAPAIMKRNVSRIGIEIKAAPSVTWSNPTVVYVDSIAVNTPALSFPFATAGTVSATAQTSDPAGQVLWLNSGMDDTTASGSRLSWVATCP